MMVFSAGALSKPACWSTTELSGGVSELLTPQTAIKQRTD